MALLTGKYGNAMSNSQIHITKNKSQTFRRYGGNIIF